MFISMTKFLFALWLTILGASVSLAAALPRDLAGVDGLRQPSETLYTAGQPQPEAFAALAKVGVRHVINLRPPSETPELNEAAVVTQSTMAYYNIPISGPVDLTRENVESLDKLLKRFGDDKVLLHCSSSNRVGALMALRAAWLDGVSAEKAIEEGQRHGLTKLQPAVERLLEEGQGGR